MEREQETSNQTSFEENFRLLNFTVAGAGVAAVTLTRSVGSNVAGDQLEPSVGHEACMGIPFPHISDFAPLPAEIQNRYEYLWPDVFPNPGAPSVDPQAAAPPTFPPHACHPTHHQEPRRSLHGPNQCPTHGPIPVGRRVQRPKGNRFGPDGLWVPESVNYHPTQEPENVNSPEVRYQKDYRGWYQKYYQNFFGENASIKWQHDGRGAIVNRDPSFLSVAEMQRFETYLKNSPIGVPISPDKTWMSGWRRGRATSGSRSRSRSRSSANYSDDMSSDVSGGSRQSGAGDSFFASAPPPSMSGLGSGAQQQPIPNAVQLEVIRGTPENPVSVPYVGYTFRGPPAELDRNTVLPKVMIFDLDGIIWNHAVADTSGSPDFETKDGVPMMLFDDVLEILSWCEQQRIQVAFTSRTAKAKDSQYLLSCYCTSFGTSLDDLGKCKIFGSKTKAEGIDAVKRRIGCGTLDAVYIASRDDTRKLVGNNHIVFHMRNGVNWDELVVRLYEYQTFLGDKKFSVGLQKEPMLNWKV